MPRTCRSIAVSWMIAALAGTPVAHATPAAPASGLALRGVAFPAASIDEADSIAGRLGFERLIRTGPGWRVISRLRNGSLLWYAAGHDTAIGGHGDRTAVPLLTGLKPGVDVGLPVGLWTEAEGEAEAMPHPNGAMEVVGMTAMVPSVSAACRAWRRAGATCGPNEVALHPGVTGARRTVYLPGGGRIVLSSPGTLYDSFEYPVRPHWTGVIVSADSAHIDSTRSAAPVSEITRQIRRTPSEEQARGYVAPFTTGDVSIRFVPR
jgi:hypothetical protein